ncbi:hypothetical protein HY625_01570, partial [Candidatus Uhrbacteria bacterium]|nr:hypothetical protein [Candidatus Uhrbacteria bacterium]
MSETKKIRPIAPEVSPQPSQTEKAETDEGKKREEPTPSAAPEKAQESFVAPSANMQKASVPIVPSHVSSEEEARAIEQVL